MPTISEFIFWRIMFWRIEERPWLIVGNIKTSQNYWNAKWARDHKLRSICELYYLRHEKLCSRKKYCIACLYKISTRSIFSTNMKSPYAEMTKAPALDVVCVRIYLWLLIIRTKLLKRLFRAQSTSIVLLPHKLLRCLVLWTVSRMTAVCSFTSFAH